MESKEYRLFASTYPTITNLYEDLIGDIALNRNGVSSFCKFTASSLLEAVRIFEASETYNDFKDKHNCQIHTYLLLENDNVQIIERK